MVKVFLSLAALLGAQLGSAQDKDAPGCKDSPLLSRFPGSVITICSHKEDDIYTFRLPNREKELEGDLTYIKYALPKTASSAQVLRNYLTALRTAGYTIERPPANNNNGDFVARQGKTWIHIDFTGNNDGVFQRILVEKELKQEMVATAAALSTGLTNNGHTVVPGILFDTGKSDLKPESAPALQEVAKLLKENPNLKLYVVGHTDNVGALAANLDLSRRRAASVVQELTSHYSVAADRLSPFGAGPYAPVAADDSEDGRALNRRVEIVKQ